MPFFKLKVKINLSDDTKTFLRELLAPLIPAKPPITVEGVDIMFKFKADQADIPYSISIGKVSDSEGNEITDPAVLATLKKSFTSSDETVLSIVANADDILNGVVHVGSPGLATLEAAVTTADDAPLATGAVSATVTTGDPAAVDNIGITLTGVAEEPIEPPV